MNPLKMITLRPIIPLLILITMNARAILPPESGLAAFKLTAVAQQYSYVTTSIKTNHTATTTNITTVIKSKATNAPINSEFILGLLENSFNTNFPSGAKLIMRGLGSFSFLVVDSTGTNVLVNASSVLLITDNASVNSGVETFIEKITPAGTKYSGNDTETITEFASLTYDDNALTTKDGTHTNFQLSGMLVDMRSTNIGTENSKQSMRFQGAGSGTIQGKNNIILKGTVTGTLFGVLEG